MKKIRQSLLGCAILLFLLFFLTACYERYPFFVQAPEYNSSPLDDGQPGVMLSISCVDKNAIIRYTNDGSEPTNSHGAIYEDPIYLLNVEVLIKSVAVRYGYEAGPIAEYHYVP